jgi:hypothetical protein
MTSKLAYLIFLLTEKMYCAFEKPDTLIVHTRNTFFISAEDTELPEDLLPFAATYASLAFSAVESSSNELYSSICNALREDRQIKFSRT